MTACKMRYHADFYDIIHPPPFEMHQADYLRFLDGLDTHSRLNMGSEVY